MKLHNGPCRLRLIVLWTGAACLFSWSARADFPLEAGDTVEISIAGVPELRTRAMVDMAGNVTIPVIGTLPASGQSIEDLRTRLQREFTNRALSMRGSDGRMVVTPVSPEDVSVTIAEYRPVYVMGDIAKVGEVAYRPGLTVKQAIVIAGGYDFVRFRLNNPYLDTIDFHAEQSALINELAREQEKERLLETELGDERKRSIEPVSSTGTRPEAKRSFDVIEEQFRAQRKDFEREVAHLRETAARMEARLSLLNEQKEKADEGMKLERGEFERTRASARGNPTSPQQIADAHRAALAAESRVLQAGAEATQAAIAREDIERAIQKLYDQRRLQLLNQLQESRSNILRIETQLGALKEKVRVTGTVKSIWTGGARLKPEIWVIRNVKGKEEQLAGSESMSLLPGDVIEVALQTQ